MQPEALGTKMMQRFEKNAPGDFYIVDGCCLTCGVMHEVATQLIAWHDFEPDEQGYVSSHCFVVRQPETSDDLVQMLDAMTVMDLDCLRYGGSDQELITRIEQIGLAEQCDLLASRSDLTTPSKHR